MTPSKPKSKEQLLIEVITKMIESGYTPSHKRQGYVLKRLLKTLYQMGGSMSHPFFRAERERQLRMKDKYQKLLPKNLNMPPEWWYDTHGISVEDFSESNTI